MSHAYEKRMSSSFYRKLSDIHLAVADLCDYYNQGLIITRINVPRACRGEGHGSALLKEITDEADRTGTTLWLEIMPSDGLTYEQLRDWYIRNGFKDLGGIFRRRPNAKA